MCQQLAIITLPYKKLPKIISTAILYKIKIQNKLLKNTLTGIVGVITLQVLCSLVAMTTTKKNF